MDSKCARELGLKSIPQAQSRTNQQMPNLLTKNPFIYTGPKPNENQQPATTIFPKNSDGQQNVFTGLVGPLDNQLLQRTQQVQQQQQQQVQQREQQQVQLNSQQQQVQRKAREQPLNSQQREQLLQLQQQLQREQPVNFQQPTSKKQQQQGFFKIFNPAKEEFPNFVQRVFNPNTPQLASDTEVYPPQQQPQPSLQQEKKIPSNTKIVDINKENFPHTATSRRNYLLDEKKIQERKPDFNTTYEQRVNAQIYKENMEQDQANQTGYKYNGPKHGPNSTALKEQTEGAWCSPNHACYMFGQDGYKTIPINMRMEVSREELEKAGYKYLPELSTANKDFLAEPGWNPSYFAKNKAVQENAALRDKTGKINPQGLIKTYQGKNYKGVLEEKRPHAKTANPDAKRDFVTDLAAKLSLNDTPPPTTTPAPLPNPAPPPAPPPQAPASSGLKGIVLKPSILTGPINNNNNQSTSKNSTTGNDLGFMTNFNGAKFVSQSGVNSSPNTNLDSLFDNPSNVAKYLNEMQKNPITFADVNNIENIQEIRKGVYNPKFEAKPEQITQVQLERIARERAQLEKAALEKAPVGKTNIWGMPVGTTTGGKKGGKSRNSRKSRKSRKTRKSRR
jgi:hypothetical protein